MLWACENCPKKKPDDLEPYTVRLLNLAAIQRGGYPFRANDLTLEEWVDLGRVQEILRPRGICPMMGGR